MSFLLVYIFVPAFRILGICDRHGMSNVDQIKRINLRLSLIHFDSSAGIKEIFRAKGGYDRSNVTETRHCQVNLRWPVLSPCQQKKNRRVSREAEQEYTSL